MLFVAIILALVLVYLIYFSEKPSPPPAAPVPVGRRVGGPFAYNDISDESIDHMILPINTVTGPGGGSLVKKYV